MTNKDDITKLTTNQNVGLMVGLLIVIAGVWMIWNPFVSQTSGSGHFLIATNAFADKDCRIPGSNPVRYNTTCEGLNMTQLNQLITQFQNLTGQLVQIPSNATDFLNNDPKVIQVQVTSATKDVIGDYHIVGEITNTGKDTLSFVRVTVHLYDVRNRLIGDSTCCYTTLTNIDAGHTSTFDSFVTSNHINGTPVFYRLSYDWS